MLRRWEEAARSDAPVTLDAEMRKLTLEIILKILFGDVPEEEVQNLFDALRILMMDLGDISDGIFNIPLDFGPDRNVRFRAALKTLDHFVAEKIQARRSALDCPHSLLATLLHAEQDSGDAALTPVQVRDEIVTMIIAGHETTAISLTWAFHLLSQNPEVSRRLDRELEERLEGRTPSVADLPQLEYARMVFEEVMRLYPPVSIVARQALVEERVGDLTIPAKGIVILSAYTTHRHPLFWNDPEHFDPERFSAQRSEKRHRFAYFPFLAGRHQCLGQPLAMIEGPLILTQVAQHFGIHALPGHPQEPSPGLALRLESGIPRAFGTETLTCPPLICQIPWRAWLAARMSRRSSI